MNMLPTALRRLATRPTAAAGRRFMGAGGHGHGHAKDYPFGMHFHVSPVHKNLALAYGTMLWLWIFWRAKQDGKVVLGLEHPWDHGHGHDDAHHGGGHHAPRGPFKYERTEVGERPTLVQADEVEDDE
ncbi:hypothetical protein Poli38472_005530 [Pythium oligandrum]|uniref:NADH dehydrogenase [ubiquinone] 1 beta subcomplex subunit 2 n=1 Tax=Pythium oligandrum TaxID=41045 RepID=A0A8K1FKK2_PYTOL|nr:hypothetical protein Poli38472_005530 [Pythium oligandrum]|eukprot:TMW62912.1 hypothetical protein Poli38472_005530 [Pythium oligandrum]